MVIPTDSFLAAVSLSGLQFVLKDVGLSALASSGLVLLVAFLGFIVLLLRRRAWVRMVMADAAFLARLRDSHHPLSIFQDEVRFEGSSRWPVYLAGCRELAFHLLGTDVVDKNFAMRLRGAGRISPSQMDAIRREMQRSASEMALDMETLHPPVFSTGAMLPWLGLLGAAAVFCEAIFNPEAAGWDFPRLLLPALLPVTLSVLFALALIMAARAQARALRADVARLELFPLELATSMDRSFVDHRQLIQELPSLASLGVPDAPSFSLPPSDSTSRSVRS